MGAFSSLCSLVLDRTPPEVTKLVAGQVRPGLRVVLVRRFVDQEARVHGDGRILDHMADFLACVKSRRETVANPEVMHRSMTTNHAINICLALGRDLKWDPQKEEFVGDAEANRLRSRALRQPWAL